MISMRSHPQRRLIFTSSSGASTRLQGRSAGARDLSTWKAASLPATSCAFDRQARHWILAVRWKTSLQNRTLRLPQCPWSGVTPSRTRTFGMCMPLTTPCSGESRTSKSHLNCPEGSEESSPMARSAAGGAEVGLIEVIA